MPEREEGAAFFHPVTPETELGVVPPRPMGLQRGMLTGGFAEAQARNNAPRVMGLQPGMLTGGFVEAQARLNAPRVMGLNPDLLTRGFPGAHGLGIANPASENCAAKGGTLSIRQDAGGNATGYCTLPDGTTCEEWAFMDGKCGTPAVEQGYWDWVAGLNPLAVAGVAAATGFVGACIWRKR